MSRRRFLLASAGMTLAVACGRRREDRAVAPPDPARDQLNLVVASYTHVAGIDQRVTVALLGSDTGPVRPEGPVEVSIDGQPVTAELHDQGIDLPYLLLRHRFQKPGFAKVRASYQDRAAEAALQVVDPAATAIPFPGRPMKAVPTPTVAEPRGVNPICTRQPPCPLHDVSLDSALAQRRPVALLLATPALCQSRLCGPVLENLLAHRDAFADRVSFVHAEIYTALDGQKKAPAVDTYGLTNEPVLFVAGADGVVRERLDNAFDKAEARRALEAIVA